MPISYQISDYREVGEVVVEILATDQNRACRYIMNGTFHQAYDFVVNAGGRYVGGVIFKQIGRDL